MKKTFSVLLALVMVLAMTVTTFATVQSPSEDVKIVGGKVTVNGQEVTLDDTNADQYVKVGAASVTAAAIEGMNLLTTVDVTLEEGVTSATIILTVLGVKKGDTVKVMQYVDGQWIEVEGVAVADNQVQVTLTHSGTVAVYVAAASTQTPAGTTQTSSSTTSTGSGSTTSPKTGETNVAAMAALLAVAFAGAAAVAAKKANA